MRRASMAVSFFFVYGRPSPSVNTWMDRGVRLEVSIVAALSALLFCLCLVWVGWVCEGWLGWFGFLFLSSLFWSVLFCFVFVPVALHATCSKPLGGRSRAKFATCLVVLHFSRRRECCGSLLHVSCRGAVGQMPAVSHVVRGEEATRSEARQQGLVLRCARWKFRV